jgi:hypothetical protein
MPGRIAAGSIGRWATVLLTITAWVLLSNHCALGLSGLIVEANSDPGGCPLHSAPKKEKPATNLLCCKDLRALATHAAKRAAAPAAFLVGMQNYAVATFLPPLRLTTVPVLALETGPPRSPSFAESILQRSILVHAPPAGFVRL